MNKINRTYLVDVQLAHRIRSTAQAHDVGDSDLVNYLLEFAFDALDEGTLQIQKRPTKWAVDRIRERNWGYEQE